MGKIKNRDKKRTSAGIFASGGAGCSNKGSPQPDKRELEYPCTFCERVFKQSGRLKEHVQRHHSEALQEETPPQPLQLENRTGISVQDVGSGNGYYTHKSPKLLLAEWCRKQSRRKPIYKSYTTQSGHTKCKVVVPDVKDAKKDIVVFLDDSFMNNAEDGEAQQRVATAALCHVAGDCAFQRAMPPQYSHIWSHYKEIYDVERREQQKEAPPPPKRLEREPQAIVMSHEKQALLERTLQQLHSMEAPQQRGGIREEWKRLMQRLIREGFPKQKIEEAMHHAAQYSAGGFVEGVLDWLCFCLDDAELPPAYKKRSKTHKVDVVRAPAELPEEAEVGEWSETEDPDVDTLMQYGYPLPAIIHALEACSSDRRLAHRSLYVQLTGVELSENLSLGQQSQWVEECEALMAIFDERCQQLDPNSVEICLDLPPELIACANPQIWKQKASKDQVEVVLLVGEVGDDYPSSFPLLGITCPAMKFGFLRYLTERLAQKCEEFRDLPMVHSLVDALMDLLAEVAQPSFQLPALSVPQVANTEPEKGSEESSDSDLMSIEEMPQSTLKAREMPKNRPHHRQWRADEARAENAALERQQQKLLEQASSSAAIQARQALPAAQMASQVVECIAGHPVVVITGMPGCGKSTQVPQFLLEDAISQGHGVDCNVVCTQPRRISAMSLAARVANERSERVGDVVGFSVRNQNSVSKRTRLTYCTTGILLRRFISDPSLLGVSHVLVDEVHERTVEMDLLLLLLKKLLEKAEAHRGVLCPKIILMSATAKAEEYQAYFSRPVGAVPIVSIPGFTFPVRQFFLEDVHQAFTEQQQRERRSGWDVGSSSDDEESSSRSLRVKKKDMDPMQIDDELIEKLVGYVIREEHERGAGFLVRNWIESPSGAASQRENGSILIFLPGAPEINRLVQILRRSKQIPSFKSVLVLPLHASLPAAEQRRVFEDAGNGVRKIIVATNVAETSVTIPDVTLVIDSCLAKEVGYDAEKRISRLKVNWISKASATQRAGRAGRVQCGVCFRLVSSSHWERLRDYTPPEITRTPLQSFCLMVLSLVGRGAPLQKHLQECLTPPSKDQVTAAMTTLRDVGAIDERQQVTALGFHLMKMPMDVHVGKMLIYGALLRCVDSVLTLAAALTHGRPLFLSPNDKRTEANTARAELYAPYQNAKSDHMAIVAAVQSFRQTQIQRGSSQARTYCRERFLSAETLFAILDGRGEYARVLADLGFLSQTYAQSLSREEPQEASLLDAYATNSKFVRAALCAGFYPNLVRAKHPPKKSDQILGASEISSLFVATQGGSKQVDADSKQIKFYDREKGRVFLHPASVNFKASLFESEWLVYSDLIETEKVYVRQCSMVPVYAMLLFSGGQARLQHRQGLLTLPSWRAVFEVHPKVGVMIKMLRKAVENILALRIENPESDSTENPVISAVMALLETDGF